LGIVDTGAIHSIGAPIHVYPLFENGFRAYRGQSIRENNTESAELYAEFAKVAEKNPLAWNYGHQAETVESIGTVTKRNRMICFPCKDSLATFILPTKFRLRSSPDECIQYCQSCRGLPPDFNGVC